MQYAKAVLQSALVAGLTIAGLTMLGATDPVGMATFGIAFSALVRTYDRPSGGAHAD